MKDLERAINALKNFNLRRKKMSILEITKKDNCNEQPCINELAYGTFVTDVPSGNNCIYVKVKKKGSESNCGGHGNTPLTMKWKSGCSVLLNLTYGSLRQIPGNTPVTPLKPCLTVAPLPKNSFYTVMR